MSPPCVRALNSLQKPMMLMPCGPKAVPTGGAGFALPPGICSLTKPVTFFAMLLPSRRLRRRTVRRRSCYHLGLLRRSGGRRVYAAGLVATELQVIEFDACGSSKKADRHAHLPLVGENFF